jgi:hypothetical protein
VGRTTDTEGELDILTNYALLHTVAGASAYTVVTAGTAGSLSSDPVVQLFSGDCMCRIFAGTPPTIA